jgi:hypothetical protein
MTPFDSHGLTSPEDHRNEIHIGVVVSRVAQHEVDLDQEASQKELAKLRNSNHQLRAENLALRTRIERLKSGRSLERNLIIGGVLALWFFFIFSVISKIIASSN